MYIPYLNQTLLFIVVTVLTVLLTLSGVQVYYILKEFRLTVKKVNKILDDTEIMTSSVAKPIAGISGFITGIKSGSDILNLFLNLKKRKNGER